MRRDTREFHVSLHMGTHPRTGFVMTANYLREVNEQIGWSLTLRRFGDKQGKEGLVLSSHKS